MASASASPPPAVSYAFSPHHPDLTGHTRVCGVCVGCLGAPWGLSEESAFRGERLGGICGWALQAAQEPVFPGCGDPLRLSQALLRAPGAGQARLPRRQDVWFCLLSGAFTAGHTVGVQGLSLRERSGSSRAEAAV